MTGPLTLVPPLPPGWERAPAPPQSGVIATVTGESGHAVTMHRAAYDVLSSQGEYTVHGYAWRCTNPACRRVTTGYPADGFGRAYGNALAHHCEEARRG